MKKSRLRQKVKGRERLKMMEREGRDKWTTVPKEMGAGRIRGRSGRIGL